MKYQKKILSLALLIPFLCEGSCAHSSQPPVLKKEVLDGRVTLKDQHFDALQVSGSFEFENLTVDHTLNMSGSMRGNNLRCENLITHGSAEVRNMHATDVSVSGAFSGENLVVGKNLTVNGSLTGNAIHVAGETKVEGGLQIENGQMNHLQLTGIKATLSNSEVQSILIKKTGSSFWELLGLSGQRAQTLELKGTTIVSGDITFEAGNGEVHLFKDAQVKGKVSGGKIVQK